MHATNWGNIPMSHLSPHQIACPCEGCDSGYEIDWFKGVLPEDKMARLLNHSAKLMNSGMVHCPRCRNPNRVDIDRLRDAEAGTVIVSCTTCQHSFCYHCLREAHGECEACILGGVGPCAGNFNRFFIRPGRTMDDPRCPIMRNYELTADVCYTQLKELCESGENVTLPCLCCGMALHRTTACNELKHCGLVRCNVCGLCGLEHERNLIDHWHQCPRWMTDQYWGDVMWYSGRPDIWQNPSLMCREGECHSDTHDCTCEAHREYREIVANIRMMKCMNTAMQSMPLLLYRQVVHLIQHNGGKTKDVLERLTLMKRHTTVL